LRFNLTTRRLIWLDWVRLSAPFGEPAAGGGRLVSRPPPDRHRIASRTAPAVAAGSRAERRRWRPAREPASQVN